MSSSKHFVHDPTHLVDAALHAISLTNPNAAVDAANKIVYRRPTTPEPAHVAILSGGGSGHEPSFAGLVGPGLLSAAVAGTIFASPSSEQVLAGLLHRVRTQQGVLVVLMNYTGDVLNFGVAIEKARSAGVGVEMVVVGDDVGVGRAQAGKVGRRGLAGTVLVLKIAGALAALGRPLEEVAHVARLTAANTVTVGASLAHVHVPGHATPPPAEQTGHDVEVEIGMGIHNEPGCGRAKLDLPALVRRMLAQLISMDDRDRAFLRVGSDKLVLLVNNLGGVSQLEMGAITAEVVSQLETVYRFRPVRILSGTYMTSLNALGFSITLLNVVDPEKGGKSLLELLDAPAEVPGWAAPIQASSWESANTATRTGTSLSGQEPVPASGLRMKVESATAMLTRGLENVIVAEPEITKFDTVVGDGDCGIGLRRGAEALLAHLRQSPLSGDVKVDLKALIAVVERTMDGTSGALYAIFLNALFYALGHLEAGAMDAGRWARVLQESCDSLLKYTPARPGDRTLVDALYPFVEVLSQTGDITEAAEAARDAAAATQGMRASLGRSVYVGGRGYEEVPDPGAWGLAVFFLGLAGMDPGRIR